MLGEPNIGHTRRAVYGGRGNMRRRGEHSLSRRPHLDLEQDVQQSGGHVAHQGHPQACAQLAAEHHTRIQEPQRQSQGQLELPQYVLL